MSKKFTADKFVVTGGAGLNVLVDDGTTRFIALDADLVHKTGDETINGTKTFISPTGITGIISDNNSYGNGISANNTANGIGINVNNIANGNGITSTNTSFGIGLNVRNTSSGMAVSVNNESTGKTIVLNNTTAATGIPFTIQKNYIDKLTINDNGEITGNKFVKSGGTSAQFLMADGSVSAGTSPDDATTTVKGIVKLSGDLGGTADLPTTPTAVHLTGDENINGVKSFNNSGILRPGIYALNNAASSGGQAIKAYTQGIGDAIEVEVGGTGKGIVISANSTGTGKLISGNDNGVEKFYLTKEGNVTANSFVKTGGTSAQFLMADGSTSAGGGADSRIIIKIASSDTSSTTTTAIKITTLDQSLPVGIYKFEYILRYQSAETNAGLNFSVNHTGTVGYFMSKSTKAGLTNTNAQGDGGNLVVSSSTKRSVSTSATSSGFTTVDVINSDIMFEVVGLINVTAVGNLELYIKNATASTTAKIMTGSTLIITKVN